MNCVHKDARGGMPIVGEHTHSMSLISIGAKKGKRPATDDSSGRSKAKRVKAAVPTTLPLLRPPTFAVKDDAALKFLGEQGYVVIRDVLTEAENDHATDLTWCWLEQLGTGIRRADASTWDNARWPNVFSVGIVDRDGIGQAPQMWYARQKARPVFEHLLGGTDLLTSLDGMSLFRPGHTQKVSDTLPLFSDAYFRRRRRHRGGISMPTATALQSSRSQRSESPARPSAAFKAACT
ncbi:Hypothetical protein UVM_LOCUS294 [uncultured virus]|nr:Hypothetical protein UVM_LOCUS294 [uncultured virus]